MASASASIEPEIAFRIAGSTDSRYDDLFVVGSIATGVYCRPSCTSASPQRENTRFFSSPRAAREEGLRPCKRCAPDEARESSPRRHSGVAMRTLRLIQDGLVDREGVRGLAARLGYSERQLHRIVVAELGASPVRLARAHRAQSARLLLASVDVTLAQVARAAGFGSIRQFNETMREVFGRSPSEMRASARGRAPLPGNEIRLQLACREPFDGVAVIRFLARHQVPGLEHVHGNDYTRALALEQSEGVVTLTPTTSSVICRVRLEDVRDLTAAVARCRRLFDLDADPVAVQADLAERPIIGELVRAHPGVRIPGTIDGFELAVRTIIRENNSPEGTRSTSEALVRRHGRRLQMSTEHVTHNFPTADALAAADPATFATDRGRARAIHALAERVAAGEIALDVGAEVDDSISRLLEVPGIGPWIASYIAMRVLGDPDAFLHGCRRIERALKRLGVPPETAVVTAAAEEWRPWRSYAVAQLWRSLDDEGEPPDGSRRH